MSIIHRLGQTVLDSKTYKANIKTSPNPDDDHKSAGIEDDCEQCEIEKLKKRCTICEPD